MMKVCLLTSGSIGNVVVIEHENESLLIDFGVSFKKFNELIAQTSLDKAKIKNILVTHEHSDHVKGIGVASRRLDLQVWATEATADAIHDKDLMTDRDNPIEYVSSYQNYEIAGFKITPFPLSHDAANPVGYIIERDGKKVVWLTDTGYVSKQVMDAVRGADLYIMELNHNVDILLSTNRPWKLKQRILSDYGHLSNEDGAYTFSQIMSENTRHVFIAHISQEGNLPNIALDTMKEVLKEQRIDTSKLSIHMTYPLSPSKIVEI